MRSLGLASSPNAAPTWKPKKKTAVSSKPYEFRTSPPRAEDTTESSMSSFGGDAIYPTSARANSKSHVSILPGDSHNHESMFQLFDSKTEIEYLEGQDKAAASAYGLSGREFDQRKKSPTKKKTSKVHMSDVGNSSGYNFDQLIS